MDLANRVSWGYSLLEAMFCYNATNILEKERVTSEQGYFNINTMQAGTASFDILYSSWSAVAVMQAYHYQVTGIVHD